MKRRCFVRIAVCVIFLTGGAITTVAVAWGCAFYGNWQGCDPVRAQVVHQRAEPWASVYLVQMSGLGIDWIVCDVTYPLPRRGSPVWDYVELAGRIGDATQVATHIEDVEVDELDFEGANQLRAWFEDEKETGIRSEVRTGWPRVCLTAFLEPQYDLQPGVDWIPVAESQVIAAGQHDLPRRVIQSGFLIDTLFYAAIWFGVFFAPGLAKRAIRRRRGRCPMCGYDLRGQREAISAHPLSPQSSVLSPSLGCPECGWNRRDDPQ